MGKNDGHVGEGADRDAAQGPADGVRGVLEQGDVAPGDDRAQPVGVDRVPGVVDAGHDGGPVGDRGRDRGRVEVAGVLADVGEDDPGAEQRGRGSRWPRTSSGW